MFFKRANSVEKQPLIFRNAPVSHCFRNSSISFEIVQIILTMNVWKGNLEITKKKNTHILRTNFL